MNVKDLRPYWSVQGYNDSPFLFREESEFLAQHLIEGSGVTEEEIKKACYLDYESLDKSLAVPCILMYKETLELAGRAGPEDIYDKAGYDGLLGGPGSGRLHILVVEMIQARIVKCLSERGLSLSHVQEASPLFTTTEIQTHSQMPFVIQGESNEDTAEILTEILTELIDRVPFRRAKHRTKPTPQVRVRRKTKPKAPTLATLLARMEQGPTPSFSAYWMAPPPISPSDLSGLSELSNAEIAFLLNIFLDIYRTESLLIAIYFLLRRVRELWSSPYGSLVSEAPYRYSECRFLSMVLGSLSEELYERYTTKFLAVEGISLSGDKICSVLSKSPGVVLNVEALCDSVLTVVRDAALCTGRLRVSLLYGPDHTSYVGNVFLSSALDTYEAYTKSGDSLETAANIVSVAASISLGEDEERMHEAMESFFERIPQETKTHKLDEPKNRRFHKDTSLVGLRLAEALNTTTDRESLSGEGELESLRTEKESPLISIARRYWSSL